MATAGRAASFADDAERSPAAVTASADRRDSCCACMLCTAGQLWGATGRLGPLLTTSQVQTLVVSSVKHCVACKPR